MKDARPLTIDEVVERLDEFDAILDARSPSEHAEDHLPTALSTPVLDDAQRALIGTMHKQQGAFEAKRAGAALVARNIADLLEQRFATMPRDWRPLVYCWRGGNRSGALATILARIGWQTSLLTGGYREFRRRVIADLTLLPARFRFVVITGRTGSGKTLLLERLAALGFSSDRPVFVESESRKVGQCQVPEHLILAMRGSACANIDTPDPVRSALLLRDYRHFVDAPARLAERLEALIPLHGRTRIEGWLAAASAGQWDEFVLAMLREHYDPAYDKSMLRNFSRLEQAVNVSLDAAEPEAVDRAAKRLIELSRINPG
jgi:tRNA 2-selenouridine synthase